MFRTAKCCSEDVTVVPLGTSHWRLHENIYHVTIVETKLDSKPYLAILSLIVFFRFTFHGIKRIQIIDFTIKNIKAMTESCNDLSSRVCSIFTPCVLK